MSKMIYPDPDEFAEKYLEKKWKRHMMPQFHRLAAELEPSNKGLRLLLVEALWHEEHRKRKAELVATLKNACLEAGPC